MEGIWLIRDSTAQQKRFGFFLVARSFHLGLPENSAGPSNWKAVVFLAIIRPLPPTLAPQTSRRSENTQFLHGETSSNLVRATELVSDSCPVAPGFWCPAYSFASTSSPGISSSKPVDEPSVRTSRTPGKQGTCRPVKSL